jgi:hypothetical protein
MVGLLLINAAKVSAENLQNLSGRVRAEFNTVQYRTLKRIQYSRNVYSCNVAASLVCFSYHEKTSAYTFLQEYLTLYKSSIEKKQNIEKKAENERQETANLTKRVLKISFPQKIEK